jgi:hypothetical protein
MMTRRLRKALSGPAARTVGLGLGVGIGIAVGSWALAPWPVAALTGTQQVLSGGQTTAQGNTRFLSPGTLFNATVDFIATGQGETAVSLPMFAGAARQLRVNLTTGSAPTGGRFILRVRKNGVNTNLRCILTQSGTCFDGGNVPFANGDLLSIQTVNTLANSGTSAFTYTIRYE